MLNIQFSSLTFLGESSLVSLLNEDEDQQQTRTIKKDETRLFEEKENELAIRKED